MELQKLSLILGLTKSELKKRLELGQIDADFLKLQVSEYSEHLKLDALCDSFRHQKEFELDPQEQMDKYETFFSNEDKP